LTQPNQDNFARLMQLSEHPLRLLREGSKIGLGSVGRLCGILLLFCTVNLLLLGYAIYKWNIGAIALVMILGLLCTAYAGKRTYLIVILDLAKLVYKNTSPLFHIICAQIVEHISKFREKQAINIQIEKVINVQKIIEDKLGKVPRIITNSVSFVLKQIPITNMLSDIQNVFVSGDKEQATAFLHEKIDKYVEESIFCKNTITWIFWLLPLNVIIPLIYLI